MAAKGQILVMGAAGRLGYAAAETFRRAGWTVRGLVRPGRTRDVPHRVEPVEAVTRDEAVQAGRGCDVVLNALNPAINKWDQNALSLAYGAIAVAEGNGATLLFPGSVWNYGSGMPPVLDESTPMQATARKGRMRVEMEQRAREACDRGMRAIVLRGGDYFGAGRGSWLDLVIAKDLERRRITYPGPLDVVHPWAYVPDFAETLLRLAERRADFAPYETFGFAGHAVTGRQFVSAIEAATKATFNVRNMSWWLIKSFGRFTTFGRELAEIEYLWRVPHQIDGSKLKSAIGDVPHTPFPKAIAAALAKLDYRP